MAIENARQFEVESILLVPIEGQTLDITQLVIEFSIYESINNPYVLGEILIEDTTVNLLASLPIQGRETIIFKVKTPTFNDTTYEYELSVAAIDTRIISGRQQVYKLNLMSYEGMVNEGVRIAGILRGSNDKVVKEILENVIDTKKEIVVEPAKFEQKWLPSLKRPFDFIYQLAPITISGSAQENKGGTSQERATGEGEGVSSLKTENLPKMSGSAGYVFFETHDGYVFKSLDQLASDGSDDFGGEKVKYTYNYGYVNTEGKVGKEHLNMLDYTFSNELNMHKQLREGLYSTVCIFFDVNKCYYEENIFKMSDTFEQMSHLGSQDKIPKGQKELAEHSTRVMAQMINSEMFHEDPDTNGADNAAYKDYNRYAIAQSNARYKLASNQELNITVPPNLTVRAGDKLELLFPNMTSDEDRKTNPYDEEHSGNYLIKNIGYNFIMRGAQPRTGTTNITLIRDSFGRKNTASKVK
jgi:hypothetical protein